MSLLSPLINLMNLLNKSIKKPYWVQSFEQYWKCFTILKWLQSNARAQSLHMHWMWTASRTDALVSADLQNCVWKPHGCFTGWISHTRKKHPAQSDIKRLIRRGGTKKQINRLQSISISVILTHGGVSLCAVFLLLQHHVTVTLWTLSHW